MPRPYTKTTRIVTLPDLPGPRRNSKPRKRHGVVCEPLPVWSMPGYLLVEEAGKDAAYWVPVRCCGCPEGWQKETQRMVWLGDWAMWG